MAEWSKNKINSSQLNNGNEWTKDDQVAIEELNAMVNAGLYAQDFAEKLVTDIDTQEVANVGTPSVTLIDGDGATPNKPYKKFKFANLKGEKGDKGDTGDKGEKGDKGDKGDRGETGVNVNCFDQIITTQEQFNTLKASSNWLGAKSVAFVGDGGNLEFTFTGSITIPSTVKQIEGFNKAILHCTQTGAAFCIAYSDLQQDTILKNIKLIINNISSYLINAIRNVSNIYNCNIEIESEPYKVKYNNGFNFRGFTGCKNIINSSVITNVTWSDSLVPQISQGSMLCPAFYSCENLINCDATINANLKFPYGDCKVFDGCKYLSNCRALISVTSNAGDMLRYSCFGSCEYLSNCTGQTIIKSNEDTSSSGYMTNAKVFNSCKYLSNCTGSTNSTGYRRVRSQTYYNCHRLVNCEGSALATLLPEGSTVDGSHFAEGYVFESGSYYSNCKKIDPVTTNIWSGANLKRDDDSCELNNA